MLLPFYFIRHGLEPHKQQIDSDLIKYFSTKFIHFFKKIYSFIFFNVSFFATYDLVQC